MASIGHFVQRVTRGARLACSGVPITTGMHCSSRAYSLLSTSPLSAHRGTRFSKVIPLPITIARDLHDNTSTKLEIPIIYVSSKSFSRIEIDVKVNPKDSSMLLEDPNGYINLWKLFDERRDLCYEYTDKLNTMRCFSCFAIDIFKELFLVAAKEGQVADFFFKFDASQILVKWDSAIVEYIAIPASQFQTGKSIYADRVVGAFTSLVYSLCRMRNGLNCKELLHLMELAQKKRQNFRKGQKEKQAAPPYLAAPPSSSF